VVNGDLFMHKSFTFRTSRPKERGKINRRGANAPLKHPVRLKYFSQRRGEETLERGEAPLLSTLPLPLIREGGQGDRLLNILTASLL